MDPVVEALEQRADAVGAGHADEVIGRKVKRLRACVRQRLDADRGGLKHLRAERLQASREAAGLCAGACDRHAQPEQRARPEPRDLLSKRCHGPDHGDRRRAHALVASDLGDRLERAAHLALTRERPRFDDRHRLRPRPAGCDQGSRDLRQLAHAHVEHERPGERREAGPVDRAVLFVGRTVGVRLAVASDKRNGAGETAVRDRDARVGAGGDAGGDAGHDLKRDPGGAQGERLLATASEHERIAALQPHDRVARLRALDHQRFGLILRHRRPASLLADEQQLGVGTGAVKRRAGDQTVVQDHVGRGDQLERAGRQQPRVTGPRADEVDAAGHVAAISSARRSRSPAPAARSRSATRHPSASGS